MVLISPQISRNSDSVTSTVPTTSRLWALGSRDSRTAQAVTPKAMMPTGTFTQNTADHEYCSTRNPPSSGPTARPSPEMPAQMPIAVGSCLRGNAATRIESDSGFRSAPPKPWTIRAPISWLSVWASAQAADASVNTTSPTRKIRLRPNRSPSLPPSRISAPKLTT